MGDIVLGAAGASILSGTETTQFGNASIQLVAVPEPSTALLGLLGLARYPPPQALSIPDFINFKEDPPNGASFFVP